MTEKERVLKNIACQISTHSTLATFKTIIPGVRLLMSFNDTPVPQFLPMYVSEQLNLPLEIGDIVMCMTNRNHKWAISEYRGKCSDHTGPFGTSEFYLREIGGKDIVRMGNEMVDVLRFIPEKFLYTGYKRKMYLWAKKAFSPQYNPDIDDFVIKCGGVFVRDKSILVYKRPHIFFQEKTENGTTIYAQPKKYIVSWNTKTRLKDIISNLNNQGLLDRDWDWSEEEPEDGMENCLKITK